MPPETVLLSTLQDLSTYFLNEHSTYLTFTRNRGYVHAPTITGPATVLDKSLQHSLSLLDWSSASLTDADIRSTLSTLATVNYYWLMLALSLHYAQMLLCYAYQAKQARQNLAGINLTKHLQETLQTTFTGISMAQLSASTHIRTEDGCHFTTTIMIPHCPSGRRTAPPPPLTAEPPLLPSQRTEQGSLNQPSNVAHSDD